MDIVVDRRGTMIILHNSFMDLVTSNIFIMALSFVYGKAFFYTHRDHIPTSSVLQKRKHIREMECIFCGAEKTLGPSNSLK